MQPSDKPRIQAILLTNTGNIALKVLSLGKSRMLVRTPEPVKLPNQVRVGFAHRGKHQGRIVMLAQVSSVQTEVGTTLIKLEYIALHSMDGKECLSEFVVRDLAHSDIEESRYRFGRGGWFYQLELKAIPIVRDDLEVEDGASQRREERIPVRVPLMYAHAGDAFRGEAYNISRNGLFVLTESRLPLQDDLVEVTFPILHGPQMSKVRITGKVCWVGAGMSAADGGGIGLKIEGWASQDDEELWGAFVQRELEFGLGRR